MREPRDEQVADRQRAGGYGREARETVVKSALTGVAATALAVMVVSPAGLGGFIGTSLASGFGGNDNIAPADDPYANLPAFPAPLTSSELDEIRGELARTTVALELTRAATEARIERVRAIAESDMRASFAPVDAVIAAPAPRAAATVIPVVSIAPSAQTAELKPGLVPAGYSGGDGAVGYQGSHQALADLMFAHENF